MWHDKSAGLGHAGEGKMVCGMTGWGEAPRKRENSSSSEVSCGRRGKESTPDERKFKWFRGELRSQREGKHPGRRKRQVVPGRKGKESTPEEGKSKSFRGARKRPFAYAQRQVVGDIRVVDWRQQSPLPQGSAPSHTLSGKSSGTLELLTGVNKVPSSKIVNLP